MHNYGALNKAPGDQAQHGDSADISLDRATGTRPCGDHYTAFVLLRIRWKYQCQHAAQDALTKNAFWRNWRVSKLGGTSNDMRRKLAPLLFQDNAEQRRLYATVGEKLPQRTTQLKRSQPRDQSS